MEHKGNGIGFEESTKSDEKWPTHESVIMKVNW